MVRVVQMTTLKAVPSRTSDEIVSVVVPVGSRVDDLVSLHRDYRRGLDDAGVIAEFFYILDGPNEAAREQLETLLSSDPSVTVIELARKFGESTALSVGIEHSKGSRILTLPAYCQIEAVAIGRILQGLSSSDMSLAKRWPRRGSWLEHFRRRIFHKLLHWVTSLSFDDLGCGARAFRRQVAQEISIYGDQHRFLPVLAAKRGFKVVQVEVPQSPQDLFRGRYKLKEYLHRILDIFTVFFLVRFTKKPLRFFGTLGSIVFLTGSVILGWLVAQRLFLGVGLADRPAMLLSSLFVVLGIQIFALGLIGELIIFTHARQIKEYTIERISSQVEPPK